MYKSFRVKNFRCFKDLQINDLGRVNLIAGKNNTGKTALMEAMYIHSGNRDVKTVLRSSLPEPAFRYRSRFSPDFDDSPANVISWDSVFHDFDTSDDIELTAESCSAEPSLFNGPYESSVKLAIQSVDDHNLDDILSQIRVEELDRFTYIEILAITSDYSKQFTYFALLDGSLSRSRHKTAALHIADFLLPRQILNAEVNSTRFTNMRKQGNLPTLLSALKVIEPRLRGLELWFDGRRPLIKCDIGLRQPLSLGDLGDGINRIASLILAMGEVPGGVMFIDEIENGIHHTVQERVWSVIRSFAHELKIQVFATTHSYEMIRAAHEAFEDDEHDDFRFHRLYHDSETGKIEARTYNEFSVKAAVSSDYEVRG
jgi:hypothetical protein